MGPAVDMLLNFRCVTLMLQKSHELLAMSYGFLLKACDSKLKALSKKRRALMLQKAMSY